MQETDRTEPAFAGFLVLLKHSRFSDKKNFFEKIKILCNETGSSPSYYRKAKKGGAVTVDETAEKLYETYYMQVYSFVMTLAGNRDTAEEITQETFFRAMTSKQSFRGDSKPLSWLCAIAKNLFTDQKRRDARQGGEIPEEQLDDAPGPEKCAEDSDQIFRIHMALHDLEEPYREVFELRVFGELSFKQIGMIFRKTESWARVTFHRARLKLKERLEENEI